jgi:hypothetical protein
LDFSDHVRVCRTSTPAKSSRTNTNDCLPRRSLCRIEGGDGVVERQDGSDVRSQSPVPHPLDDLTQLGTIGFDDEVDSETVGGRVSDGPTRSVHVEGQLNSVPTNPDACICTTTSFIAARGSGRSDSFHTGGSRGLVGHNDCLH